LPTRTTARPCSNPTVTLTAPPTSAGTDIHISLGARNSTEYKGIVAEMPPQLGHPAGWDVATLNKIKTAQLQVLVVGGLTYDNEHKVNDDPAHSLSGQPTRISLWEIHPITESLVCAVASCDPANHVGWQSLSAWAAGH
jgi:hypothetical protein